MNGLITKIVAESVTVSEAYPVGSIYIAFNDVGPESLFGGTWTKIQNAFLLTAGSTYAAGSTGGSATHTLTTSEMPSHTHTVGAHSHGLNSHTHGLNDHTHSVGAHSHGLNSHTHGSSYSGASNGAHRHNMQGYYTCGDQRGSSQRRYQVTSQSVVSNRWEYAGAHSHTMSGTTAAASGSTADSSAFNSGGNSGNTAAASGSTANSTAFNTGSSGSGAAFSTMPPYLSVNVWKRTA